MMMPIPSLVSPLLLVAAGLASPLAVQTPVSTPGVTTPAAATTPSDQPWNVLVLVADDLGFADIGCQGQEYIETPNIDSLAEDGMRFTRAYTAAALSTPARQALLTGRYPQRSGVELDVQYVDRMQGIASGEVTLAEMFKSAGYSTSYVGKWGLGMNLTHHPAEHGFDEFFGFLRDWRRYLPRKPEAEPDRRWALLDQHEIVTEETFGTIELELARKTAEKIIAHKDEPFFHVHAFNAARGPLQIQVEFGQEYRDLYRGLLSQRRTRMLCVLARLDEAAGIVLAGLEEAGVADRTIVIFTSDNGGRDSNDSPADNAPHRGWAGELLEGGIRVPLLVRWPGRLAEGSTYDEMVSLMDIVPTLRAACGVTTDLAKPLDGVDLGPFVDGRIKGHPHESLYFRQGSLKGAVVRADGQKLVWNDGIKTSQYYNLQSDASEENRLDAEFPARRNQLRVAWREWSAGLRRPAWRRIKDPLKAEAAEDEETKEQQGQEKQ